jgi:predicted GIY-YIG superfamily endonuclease
MYYIYLIRSISYPDQTYIGFTKNLEKRLANHNTGSTFHTSKFKPWTIVMYFAFSNKNTAIHFEKYLKSGTGRAFVTKRLL